MHIDKVSEYRKSIRFELIRANFAFDEFISFAAGFITEKFDDANILAKIKIFDAYARWCGHLYESLLALVIIDEQNQVSESSTSDITDKEIQREAEKSLNRYNVLVKAGKFSEAGHITPVLDASFSSDLRKVRNKCSFHCTNNRIKSDILQEFLNKHHQMAFCLFTEYYGKFGHLNSECNNDLGAINQFFESSKTAAEKN
jgi:hypothetical protein